MDLVISKGGDAFATMLCPWRLAPGMNYLHITPFFEVTIFRGLVIFKGEDTFATLADKKREKKSDIDQNNTTMLEWF